MISGRGLGHTGGTLDKLESIAGYNVRLTRSQIKQTIKKCGFALAGQTRKLVPADRKLYALRDATDRLAQGESEGFEEQQRLSAAKVETTKRLAELAAGD